MPKSASIILKKKGNYHDIPPFPIHLCFLTTATSPNIHVCALPPSAKDRIGIEEYSFSQATLEQVFLEFAKGQKDDNEDDHHDHAAQLTRSLSSSHSA